MEVCEHACVVDVAAICPVWFFFNDSDVVVCWLHVVAKLQLMQHRTTTWTWTLHASSNCTNQHAVSSQSTDSLFIVLCVRVNVINASFEQQPSLHAAVDQTNQTPSSLKQTLMVPRTWWCWCGWLLPGLVSADIWGDPCLRGQGDTGILHRGWYCGGPGLQAEEWHVACQEAVRARAGQSEAQHRVQSDISKSPCRPHLIPTLKDQ